MCLTAGAREFLVFLISVSVVQGQDGWRVTYTSTQICALKGSTVEIRCTYTYPSRINGRDTKFEETFWFTKFQDKEPVDLRTDSKYAGRVEYHCDKKDCTMRITDLRESDSAEYKFRFITNQPDGRFTGSPGVTLSVTVLQVQWSRLKSCLYKDCIQAQVKCHSSCHLSDQTSYIWYKNGQKIDKEAPSYSDYFYSADSYSCALTGHTDFPSPSVCVYRQTCNRVTYTDRSICAFKGSSVDISCTYNSYSTYIRSRFWFRPVRSLQWQNPSQPEDLSEDSQYAGRVQVLDTEGGRSTLRITDLRESDSAEYHFKFTAGSFEWRSSLPGTTLTVTDPDLQVQVIWSSTGPKLICHSSCLRVCSSFVWYKNENKIMYETSPSYRGYIDPTDSYSCAYKDHRSLPVYAPVVPSVLMSPTGEIVKNSSLSLTCVSDANPVAKYSWYKKNKTLLSKEPQLVISSIQSSDSGEYYCTAENELGNTRSKYVFINVKYGPKTSNVSVSPSGEIVEGSSVTLTCSSDANPAANYTWYKENQILFQGPEGIYHFTSISSVDSGIYYCKSENQYREINSTILDLDVQYAPKLPSVSVSPSAEIVEGSSVTLTCSSDANPAANYTWYKENQTLTQGPEGSYYFNSISSKDTGIYYCKSDNRYGQINSLSLLLNVQYAPKLPSVSVSPSAKVVKGSSVSLTCSSDANPAANYTWYKENEDSPKASGQNFTITDFRAEHSGKYYCEAQNKRGRHNSTLHLTVVAVFPGLWKLAVFGTTPAVFLAIIWLSVLLLIKKKRSSKQSSEPGDRPDDREQDDLHYASFHFSNNQTDPVYSNIIPAVPRRQKEEEEEEELVEYAAVQFNSASTAPRSQETVEDPAALYSTVNKTTERNRNV